MKNIVWQNNLGEVAITYVYDDLNLEEHAAKLISQGDISGQWSVVLTNAQLPEQNNDFFNAWVCVNGSVTVDFAKAKKVTKDRLRREREPLFAVQDVAFQRALETGSSTVAIVAEKQRLRDLPALADSAATLDELRALHA